MTLPIIPQNQQPVDHSAQTGAFTDVKDIRAAIADPRYSQDPAYEARISARLDQTAPEVFTDGHSAPVDEVVEAVNAQRQAVTEQNRNQLLDSIDLSSITPILDSGELISLMSDPRYSSPYGHAFRMWVDARLNLTPETTLLGIRTRDGNRNDQRFQMGTDKQQ